MESTKSFNMLIDEF